MSGPTPRYMAEHFFLPQLLEERGAASVLAAIEAKNAEFFVPVWSSAGFRFTPTFLFTTQGALRIGVLTFPQPTDVTEAYLGAVVGKATDPKYLRYFLWEEALSGTVIGEWNEEGHITYGAGPPVSGNLQSDAWELTKRVLGLIA